MSHFNLADNSHRRLNALTGEWALVSPRRTKRPWQGQLEDSAFPERTQYDAECYLCPGNHRAGGVANPAYTRTFVFQNDFSALLPDAPGSVPAIAKATNMPGFPDMDNVAQRRYA